MKKIPVFLLFALLAISLKTNAQITDNKKDASAPQSAASGYQVAKQTTKVKSVSTADFLAKADELDQLITQNKTDEAKSKYMEVLNLVNRQMAYLEEKEEPANTGMPASTKVDRRKISDLYSAIISCHIDLAKNREALHNNLKEFDQAIR